MATYFLDRILPGLITSAFAVGLGLFLQGKWVHRRFQRITAQQTKELKQVTAEQTRELKGE